MNKIIIIIEYSSLETKIFLSLVEKYDTDKIINIYNDMKFLGRILEIL